MKLKKKSIKRIVFFVGYGIEKDGHRGVCGPEKRFLQTCQIIDSQSIFPIVIYPHYGRLIKDFEQLHQQKKIYLSGYTPKNRKDFFKIVYKTIKLFSPHAIHCQGPHLFDAIAVLLGKLFKIKIIITRPVNISQDHLSKIKKRILLAVDQLVIRHANHLIAISDTHKTQWTKELTAFSLQNNFNKIQVVYNGIHLNEFFVYSNRPAPCPVVFTISAQLTPVKGHKLLLEVAHKLYEAGCQFYLNILGDGPLKFELEKIADELNITTIVRFHGHLSKIVHVLEKTHVVVLPSLREGLSLALLEGMAMGCPLIASNVGASKELIDNGENGFLIRKNNSLDLFIAMKWFIDHPSSIQKMGKKSLLKVKKFDIYKMVDNYKNIYLLD
ncbi:glycosyl transferase group 1 [Candidatus Magnetomorum sp. HK-1]|nr:glycosyl transferase group 1 [Candidatus Magnetomorum sp. HK-1]